jgi:hypothetical protein
LRVGDAVVFLTAPERFPAPLPEPGFALFFFERIRTVAFLRDRDERWSLDRRRAVLLLEGRCLPSVSLTTARTALFRLRILEALRFTAACKALKASLK